jgi:hypothetical protein
MNGKAGVGSKQKHIYLLLAALAGVSSTTRLLTGAESGALSNQSPLPRIELRNVESIILEPHPPIGTNEEARVRRLIKNLSKIESPDVGLCSTLSGEAFAPIPAFGRMDSGLLTNHQLKQSEDFRELVRLGPKALPYLLDALVDQTPTKLVMKHDDSFGGMWFDNELWGNPGNEKEQKILGPVPKQPRGISSPTISSFSIRIGDVCFVIIGQIVGRSYQAVRYQPTACVVVNSPTHDTNLANQVRSIWSSDDSAQHLMDSLLLDYASRGSSMGRALGGRSVGSSMQSGAAMRLLYYFPRQTTNMIAGRLRSLDLSSNTSSRDLANEVSTVEFIKAVAWSKEPAIQAELRRIFQLTSDQEILCATVAAKDTASATAFKLRLEQFIADLPATETGRFGDLQVTDQSGEAIWRGRSTCI